MNLEQYSNMYYQVVYSINKNEDGIWAGKLMILRRDTGQEVRGGCARYGNNKQKIEDEIYDFLKAQVSSLSNPPDDWESGGRKILAHLQEHNNKIVNYAYLIESNKVNAEKLLKFSSDLINNTLSICKDIDSLSETEREEILICEDSIYENPVDDPWNLDELNLKTDIFKYFLKPTKSELETHKLHEEKYKEAIETYQRKEKGTG